MKWLAKFKKRNAPLPRQPDDQTLLNWLNIDPDSATIYGEGALRIAVVFACVKILSEAVAKLPVKVYQNQAQCGVVANHPLTPLLRLRPNPHMSAVNFFGAMQLQCHLHGNAYALIDFHPQTGAVQSLYPLDATKVRVLVDDAGLLGSHADLWYEVSASDGVHLFQSSEILHFKTGVTLDGIIGISPIEQLKLSMENASATQEFINKFYKQGLQVKGLIHYTGDLNEQKKQEFMRRFEEMSSGIKNAHRIAMLPMGYTFAPMSLTLSDAQFLENAELTLRQIAAAFGIKPHQLGDLSRATHSNIEHQQQQFYTDTTQILITANEQELSYKLFTSAEIAQGYYLKINIDAVLRADLQTRYEAYVKAIANGLLTANEARAKEDLPPLAGGDALIVNGSMLPIQQVGEQYQRVGEN